MMVITKQGASIGKKSFHDLRQKELSRALGLVLSTTLSLGLASTVWAQQTQVSEGITVSASRIERSGFTAPTPTTTVGAADIDRLAATNLADVLNQLPAFRPTASSLVLFASAYPGQSYLDLRGLGITRTLTLVDGRRFVPTNDTGQFDISLIPASLIERTEVVTGGASAAWGSDAVAGVANLILKKNLEGIQGSVQAGSSAHHDNRSYNASLAWGTSFADGRGHVSVAGEYDKSGEIKYYSDRDWGRTKTVTVPNPAFVPGNGQPANIIADNVGNIQGAPGGLIVSSTGGVLPVGNALRGIQFGAGSAPTNFDYGQILGNSGNAIGGNGTYIMQTASIKTPGKRATLFTDFSYDITDNVQAFAQVSYGQNKNLHGHGNANFDLGTNAITIQSDNAYLNTIAALAPVKAAMGSATSFQLGRINLDFGVPDINVTATAKRFVGGFKGSIGENWKWSTYYEKGNVDYKQRIYNTRLGPNAAYSTANIDNHWAQAIDAVVLNGAIVCRSAAARAQGCQPLNPFGYGQYSQAAKDYVTGTQAVDQTIKQDVFEANLSGAAFDNWAGPVSLATGAVYRKDSIVSTVDYFSLNNIYWFGNPKPFTGKSTVKEAFVETDVPLLSQMVFAKALDFNAAVRRLDYSTSGAVTTWKTGLTWEPVDGLKLRTTRSRDIRAPNMKELFSFQTPRQAPVSDPLNPGLGTVTRPATQGGNPNLKPERAITQTLGVVLQPAMLKGFSASVDVYKIYITDAIGAPDAQTLVNTCAAKGGCVEVQRDAAGNISNILLGFLNVAYQKVKGVDVELAYKTKLPADWGGGKVDVRWLASYLDTSILNAGTPGAPDVQYAGQSVLPGNPTLGTATPHLTWTATTTYAKGPYSVSAQVRYVGPGNIDNAATPNTIVETNTVASRTYLGLSGDYVLQETEKSRLQLYWAVDNVFDKDPPRYSQGGQTPFYANAAFFDPIGRNFRLGLRFKY